jgi:hypothetical protein
MKTAPALVAWLLAVSPAFAAEPKPKAAKAKMDFGLPTTFKELPKGDDVVKPKHEEKSSEPTVSAGNATYQVVRLQFGRSFLRTAAGATPVGNEMLVIPLVGNPPSTDKFTSVIRIKSPQRVNAPIDVVIMDGRGDTAMTATGDVNFRRQTGDEVDYTIDWERTPVRAGGQFKVLVRVANQVMGSWPIQVGDEPKAGKDAGQ